MSTTIQVPVPPDEMLETNCQLAFNPATGRSEVPLEALNLGRTRLAQYATRLLDVGVAKLELNAVTFGSQQLSAPRVSLIAGIDEVIPPVLRHLRASEIRLLAEELLHLGILAMEIKPTVDQLQRQKLRWASLAQPPQVNQPPAPAAPKAAPLTLPPEMQQLINRAVEERLAQQKGATP